MKNSNRDNRSGGASSSRNLRGTAFEERSFDGRGDNRRIGDRNLGRPLKKHKATCSECGKECELPFKPTGDKPVFCSNCFGNKANSNRSGRRDSEKSNFHEKRGYSAICNKCGNKCEVPFRPTGGKPIYCSNCFGKGANTGGKNTVQLKKEFERLNAKLDTILKLLPPIITAEVVREQNITRETEVFESPAWKQQTKKTAPSKKAIKKKVVTKKTVAKKVLRKKKN